MHPYGVSSLSDAALWAVSILQFYALVEFDEKHVILRLAVEFDIQE
jgi:hypothetical protein